VLNRIDQAWWLECLFVERDNIRAALARDAKTHTQQAELYLSNGLRSFWESYDLRQGARWLRERANALRRSVVPKAMKELISLADNNR
jgi:hypothetical protein